MSNTNIDWKNAPKAPEGKEVVWVDDLCDGSGSWMTEEEDRYQDLDSKSFWAKEDEFPSKSNLAVFGIIINHGNGDLYYKVTRNPEASESPCEVAEDSTQEATNSPDWDSAPEVEVVWIDSLMGPLSDGTGWFLEYPDMYKAIDPESKLRWDKSDEFPSKEDLAIYGEHNVGDGSLYYKVTRNPNKVGK